LTFDLKRRVATQDVKVVVAMEQGRRSSDGNGSGEAVDQLSHCFPVLATRAVQRGCVFVVGRLGGQQRGARKQSSKVVEVLLVSDMDGAPLAATIRWHEGFEATAEYLWDAVECLG
jgi:hypothetical protein